MPDTALFPPFDAYQGSGPYVFVSYSHADSAHVFPEIARLHHEGLHIWFDEGIDPGNEWPDEIADALTNATVFLVFLSPRSAASRNVKNEINFALNSDKPILAIHLEETKLPSGLALRMGDIQAILRYRMNEDSYWRKLLRALTARVQAQTSIVGKSDSPVSVPLGDKKAEGPIPIRLLGTGESALHPKKQTSGDFARKKVERGVARNLSASSFEVGETMASFRLPSISLLLQCEEPKAFSEEELRKQAKVLEDKYREFGASGKVIQINPGPIVTTFEFRPEAGVKYSFVIGLAENLSDAIGVENIFIERIAGKSTVGIQIPNHERETVYLRDVLESDPFRNSQSRLTLGMGKDSSGGIVTADLASSLGLLIAGAPGSGKATTIRAMILSLLFRSTPNRVRLILVDPTRVNLCAFEGLPHLLTPIVTEPKVAAKALANAVREMERRLKLLASKNVRNIEKYNKLFDVRTGLRASVPSGEQGFPYIVIIIDELADLMAIDPAKVEESITTLAQMGRAVGIHLILATERSNPDVITGLIKANFPSRISFRQATKADSRAVLDANGAEALLGGGDMLFLPVGASRFIRLHAPCVSEKEVAAVVDYWKAQGTSDYAEGFVDSH